MRRFEAEGLVEGTTARCTVRAPVPWTLHFDVDVHRVVPEALVEGRATGAIEGPARLEIGEEDGHAVARLVWEVQLRDPVLRAAARMASPLLEWGQRWVVDTGVAQFRRRALSTPPTTAP